MLGADQRENGKPIWTIRFVIKGRATHRTSGQMELSSVLAINRT